MSGSAVTPKEAGQLGATKKLPLEKGKRVVGMLRDEVTEEFVRRYEAGEAIRQIAASSGRSYGFVQGLLKDAGVSLRARGGARVRRKAYEPDRKAAVQTAEQSNPSKPSALKTSPVKTKPVKTKPVKKRKTQ